MFVMRTCDAYDHHIGQDQEMFLYFRDTDVCKGGCVVLLADLCLKFSQIDGANIFIGEISEVIEQLLMRTKDGFAAIKLMPFSFYFILRP